MITFNAKSQSRQVAKELPRAFATLRLCVEVVPAVLAPAIIFALAFLPDATFAGMDFVNLALPEAGLAARALAAGRIPLWNWWHWGGCPLLAPMQAALAYPPTWVVQALAAATGRLPWAMQLGVLVHLAWAAIGAMLLARRVSGAGAVAAAYAGAAFAGGGFVFGHLEQTMHVNAFAWTPWVILTAFRLAATGRGAVALAACVAMGLLSGHPQGLVLTLLFAGPAAAWVAWDSGTEAGDHASRRIPTAAKAMGALILGIAFAAIQVLPTRELAPLSERVWPWPDPMQPALSWKHLPALVIPRFFNGLAGTSARPLGFTELGLYAGLLTTPLALAGLIAVWRAPARREARALSMAAAAALLFALGAEGGMAPWLSQTVPLLGQSRGAARALAVFALVHAVMAAAGLHALAEWLARRPFPKIAVAAPAVAVVALVADLAIVHRPELRARLVDASVLRAAAPPAGLPRPSPAGPGRVHRLFARDSDFDLDDRATAVRARLTRLQPGLNAPPLTPGGVATLDGYEQGLLPTRAWANFLRRYNRNLRQSKPDASLLAMAGAAAVFAELPVAADGAPWTAAGPGTGMAGDGSTAAYTSSPAPVPWFVTDRDSPPTSAPAGFDLQLSRTDLPATGPVTAAGTAPFREPPWSTAESRPHVYSAAAPPVPARAQRFVVTAIEPNGLHIRESLPPTGAGAGPGDALWLSPPYPGWKALAADGRAIPGALTAAAPIFWRVAPASAGRPAIARIAFQPFSFRLGMFISLAALAAVAASAVSRFRRLD